MYLFPSVSLSLSHDSLQDAGAKSPYTGTSQFVPTTKRIAQFSEGREPNPGDKIVYVPGAFDLFRILSHANTIVT